MNIINRAFISHIVIRRMSIFSLSAQVDPLSPTVLCSYVTGFPALRAKIAVQPAIDQQNFFAKNLLIIIGLMSNLIYVTFLIDPGARRI